MKIGHLSLLVVWILATVLLSAQNFKYSYIPKKIYLNQLFPVTILATDIDAKQTPKFIFKNGTKPILPKPLREINGKSIFYTFYFKAKDGDFRLPDLTIITKNYRYKLRGEYLSVYELDINRGDYCGVMASDFRIKNSQVSSFDEKNNLVYLTIEAHEANLEDMHINGVVEQGVERIKRRYSLAIVEYYLVIPAKIKEISFTYYNTIKQQLIPVSVNIDYKHKLVAAQEIELNPKDSSFTKLKKYTFTALSIFFLIMLLWQKDFFYLVLFVITVITLLTFFMPHKKICIKQGSPLYILPIPNSTIGTRIDNKIIAPVLHTYKEYYKIEYKPGVIGWIKEDNVCKD